LTNITSFSFHNFRPQGESRVLPFSERTCDLLEAQYKLSVEQGQWGKRFDLPSEDKRGGSDVFIFNSPQSMIQYLAWPYDLSSTTNSGNVVAGTSSPFIHLDPSQISQEMSLTGQLFEGRVCYLHRGLNEQLIEQIDEGDYKPIDQLFFIVHGIGSIYNLKGQGLIECVNDMRNHSAGRITLDSPKGVNEPPSHSLIQLEIPENIPVQRIEVSPGIKKPSDCCPAIGYWSPCAPLVWNPVKAPDIRFSSFQFRKQHPPPRGGSENTAKQLSQTHFPHHPYRMEFLPILWHDELHSDTVTGLDKQLEQITLGSIPKLRQFTNDSLMDILFYTSSKYSQLIVNTVAREITRLRELFISRNPNFTGNISIIGHSLGAVISFDLLCHQAAYNSLYTTATDQSPTVSFSTVHNNNNNRTIGSTFITNTDSQSKTINDVDELHSEVKVDQFTHDIMSSSKISATTFPASTITSVTSSISSCSNGSTTMVTDTNTSLNISSLSSASSSSTCPSKDHTNDENKSEHSITMSDAGQNDMGEWSIVDDCDHHRNRSKSKLNNDNNTNGSQSQPMLNLSLNNISQLNEILSQNGLNVDQTRSILQSILKWNKINQFKSKSVEDLEKENSYHDMLVNSSIITGQILPNIVTTASNSMLTSFWLENHCFYANQCNSNNAGFGITLPNYPQLGFPISGLYTLGSPIPLFLTARGIKTLSSEFHLPTCSTFYNIFHPFDPVAYRMETLIDSEFQQKSVLIPHHKGRKRIHLQLKDNLAWVGSELKSKFYNSVQSTWRSLHEFALAHKFISASGELGSGSTAYTCGNSSNGDELDDYENVCNLTDNRNDVVTTTYRNLTTHDLSFNSRLNQGRRIDYVLQEAALESFNEYLFALTSHGTYWDSVDTVLFILTEAYSEKGIAPIMPGQKNVPENTIHVRALSPLTSTGSTSVHSMLNPSSVTADLLVNVNNDHQMPASQQVDHLVSLSSVNQNQPYPITTTVASTVSSISRISNIQGQLPPSLPYITPPPVILTTTTNNNTHYMQTTVIDSYYQVPISQHYSSAGPPSSHIFSDCLTQKYIAPQISVCMSQEFSNTAGNYMQTQKQQHYSNIPAYAHRKQSSVNNSTTSSFTPSIPPFHSATPPTSCISVDHPICVVPSIIPDLLCTPTNIFIPTSTVMENTFCSSSQMFPPVSQ
uniref:DDHD domain-containing protein n=1 Tax=Schistosoma curassoni TaxID=6186 RepID=A0A183K6E1_9TREM